MPNITVNSLPLPADLYWEDEFTWSPMKSAEAVSITGATILQVSRRRTSGRRITLKSGDDTAWITRAQLDVLTALSKVTPTEAFTLAFADGRTFQVVFDTTDSKPIESEALQPGKVPAPGDVFRTTLRFMEYTA